MVTSLMIMEAVEHYLPSNPDVKPMTNVHKKTPVSTLFVETLVAAD